jgi:hypothetical protein
VLERDSAGFEFRNDGIDLVAATPDDGVGAIGASVIALIDIEERTAGLQRKPIAKIFDHLKAKNFYIEFLRAPGIAARDNGA